MSASKLSLFNGALRIIGERSLLSLSENREPRRRLDTAWDGGALKYCLEAGLWNFAMRTGELTYAPSITPDFGMAYAFTKPDDYVRTAGVWSDEYLKAPLIDYRDEANTWFSDIDTIYISYVSNDAQYGADFSLWPETFTKFVEAHLASEIAMAITQNRGKFEDAIAIRKAALKDAQAKDAMAQPTSFPPSGSWSRSRMNGQRTNWGRR